jgi:nitroimidazol reductase NimA-like FMN-containing flavoprotein (pyridoxamine 5'-phosphate oxidase superfamily)
MQRIRQQLSDDDCVKILNREKRGVLSVLGDDGYPYGLPINYWRCPDDGRIYFHGGLSGHKIDALRRHDKVSFCVYDKGVRQEDEWFLRFRSVIVFGRIVFVEDRAKTYEISRRLSYKFTADETYIESEIRNSGPGTLLFALIPEHMTGKLVKEC